MILGAIQGDIRSAALGKFPEDRFNHGRERTHSRLPLWIVYYRISEMSSNEVLPTDEQ